MVPVVRYLNNRERLMLPEAFKSEVTAVGTCQRTQVALSDLDQRMNQCNRWTVTLNRSKFYSEPLSSCPLCCCRFH